MLFDLATLCASARPMPLQLNPAVDRPSGCYTCRYFGERRDPAIWCGKPRHGHLRSQAERGCAFWEREPGAEG